MKAREIGRLTPKARAAIPSRVADRARAQRRHAVGDRSRLAQPAPGARSGLAAAVGDLDPRRRGGAQLERAEGIAPPSPARRARLVSRRRQRRSARPARATTGTAAVVAAPTTYRQLRPAPGRRARPPAAPPAARCAARAASATTSGGIPGSTFAGPAAVGARALARRRECRSSAGGKEVHAIAATSSNPAEPIAPDSRPGPSRCCTSDHAEPLAKRRVQAQSPTFSRRCARIGGGSSHITGAGVGLQCPADGLRQRAGEGRVGQRVTKRSDSSGSKLLRRDA